MTQHISFNSFARQLNVHTDRLSYNKMVPPVEYDSDGDEIPHRPPSLALESGDIYRLLRPYLTVRFMDQFKAVTPFAL